MTTHSTFTFNSDVINVNFPNHHKNRKEAICLQQSVIKSQILYIVCRPLWNEEKVNYLENWFMFGPFNIKEKTSCTERCMYETEMMSDSWTANPYFLSVSVCLNLTKWWMWWYILFLFPLSQIRNRRLSVTFTHNTVLHTTANWTPTLCECRGKIVSPACLDTEHKNKAPAKLRWDECCYSAHRLWLRGGQWQSGPSA